MAAAAALWEAKRALRAELRRRLRALSEVEKRRQSRLLGRQVIGHPKYKESQRIAVFLSMQDEIQTEDIIKDIFKQGKECFIPQYKPQSNHMDMLKLVSVEEISSLPVTSWNILQPSDDDIREEALSRGGLDLILMPGLGFDKNGNRLGRGKGYYDTYLERCMKHPRGKPYTIALAFKEQICESVPVSENDIQIDEVLYEDS
ncbi:5-formyltetrahydrofolate cyclo-ligase isoform X1 [Alligator mississippiensis]|uniref:5-formyltetrahydrofolate cyclo-ligase isoform X1 n=1 Tax=Alligator mississippiensis TaxID=8496 RepID=UPI0028778490|nr:5-formyltetrahydrofolate cyclo-ligase isoform X1 [Alligator mississippiensis]